MNYSGYLIDGEGNKYYPETFYYKDRDVADLAYLILSGCLTTGSTEIMFYIPLDKKIGEDINTIEISLTRCQIRHSDGGYIGNNVDLASLGTIRYVKALNGLRVICTLSTAATFTNNCPVSIYIVNGKITFNK